jgi:hypothetical protein
VLLAAPGAIVAGRSAFNRDMASSRLRYVLLLFAVVVVIAGAKLHWFA